MFKYEGIHPAITPTITAENLLELIPLLSAELPSEAMEKDTSRGFLLFGYSGNWVRYRLHSVLGPTHWREVNVDVKTTAVEATVKGDTKTMHQCVVTQRLEVGNWEDGEFKPIWWTQTMAVGRMKDPADALRSAETTAVKTNARSLGVGIDAWMGLLKQRAFETEDTIPEERYQEPVDEVRKPVRQSPPPPSRPSTDRPTGPPVRTRGGAPATAPAPAPEPDYPPDVVSDLAARFDDAEPPDADAPAGPGSDDAAVVIQQIHSIASIVKTLFTKMETDDQAITAGLYELVHKDKQKDAEPALAVAKAGAPDPDAAVDAALAMLNDEQLRALRTVLKNKALGPGEENQ